MNHIEPHHEFRNLAASDISHALHALSHATASPPNPITMEIGRLAAAYVDALCRDIDANGFAVPDFLNREARWPIEAAAKEIAIGVICDSITSRPRQGLRAGRKLFRGIPWAVNARDATAPGFA